MVSSFEEGTCHLSIFLLCVPIVFLASKSGMSITYSGYWYPPSLDNSLTTKPNISTVNLSISNGLSKQCSLPKTLSLWSVGHLLKKNWKQWKKKRETRHIPPLKRVEIRGSNKKTKNFLSVSPFPPSPLNILSSIRSGFDRVPTSWEPLFGSATQVTKVCYILPTQNSTYQP